MTAIERTAYPRFSPKAQYRKDVLELNYQLSHIELEFIKKLARNTRARLNIATQLKCIQNIGYFVDPEEIPKSIQKYLRSQLLIKGPLKTGYSHRSSKSTHRNKIRDFLGINKWDRKTIKNGAADISSQRFALNIAFQSAQTLNHPADIINIVIETMLNQKYELPSFNILDRLVRHAKYAVNNKIFSFIKDRLVKRDMISLFDKLLLTTDDYQRTGFNAIKRIPKSVSPKNFRELLKHYNWLHDFGEMESILVEVSKNKLHQFAAQAKSLDASDLWDMSESMRYSLIAALLFQAQKECTDALVTACCRIVFKIQKQAKELLEKLRDQHAENAKKLADFLKDITHSIEEYCQNPDDLTKELLGRYDHQGGTAKVAEECDKVSAYNSKNHLPLILKFFHKKRALLLGLLKILRVQSATQDYSLIHAIKTMLILSHKRARLVTLEEPLYLTFASEEWQRLIYPNIQNKMEIDRHYFEACIFTYLANDLRSGDIFIEGGESYADYRKELLTWEECIPLLNDFCSQAKLADNAKDFVQNLKQVLSEKALKVDRSYPDLTTLIIDEHGVPMLKKKQIKNPKANILLDEIRKRMPERNLVDILCNTQQYTNWAVHFGPITGNDPKMENSLERYIITVFANGTGMGPVETARHVRSNITAHILSWINRRHVNLKTLDKAMVNLINYSSSFAITAALGDSKRAAVDGTFRDVYQDNLIAESHFRYRAKGGVAYHHISDNYIAIFSTFIPCGMWEAIEIIEGLMKNESDLQPNTVHGDTQSQSLPVFALGYLFLINIMPRIRNWKDLKFFRPNKKIKYKHIDSLFSNAIDWNLIETHWPDLMQVALSIKHGKISSSTILRKLSNYSRKNRLYSAFQELGRVIRTIYLLDYISDVKLRETITQSTNKVEAYNGLSEWCFFGAKYIVASNDSEEMEKAIKYNMVICNSIILQNLVDMSEVLHQLQREGWKISKEDVARLSPYLTEHIKRFGDYMVNLSPIPCVPDEIRLITLL